MTGFPGSPRTLRGGFVVMDADGRAVLRTVPFQYNPDTLTRTLAPRGAATDTGDRLETLRLTGPPVETLKLEIVLDATDRLEHPQANPTTVAEGIAADLAELETMISPATADLVAASRLARQGALEILPLPSPLLHRPHAAGAGHRVHRDRGGVRPAPQPDPGPRRAGPARAVVRRRSAGIEGGRTVSHRGPPA